MIASADFVLMIHQAECSVQERSECTYHAVRRCGFAFYVQGDKLT
jgi:hypothetical protein